MRSVIRLGEDSIVHPELTLRFNLASQNLALIRTEEGLGPQPFKDSYHSLVLDCDVLAWKMNENRIRLEGPPGASRSRAILFSEDFFDEDVYRDMQGIDPVHPLVRVYQHVRDTQDSTFTSRELAASLRLSEKRPDVDDPLGPPWIPRHGPSERVATATGKLLMTGNAAGRRDHDVLYFLSETVGGQNGEINLLNRLLKLDGVSRVDVSRDRGVIIEPRNGRVVVAEDRDFEFAGGVRAGNLEFDGSDYVFDYESFSIELNAVESCKLKVNDEEELDARGRAKRKQVRNKLESIQGCSGGTCRSTGRDGSATGIRNTRCSGRSSPAMSTGTTPGLSKGPMSATGSGLWWSPLRWIASMHWGARNWCSMARWSQATCSPH